MPLPKRRHSHSRTHKRRANWKLKAPGYVECSQCHKPRLPHHACPACGWYNGRQVTQVKKKAAAKK